jgi:hypothetical protein
MRGFELAVRLGCERGNGSGANPCKQQKLANREWLYQRTRAATYQVLLRSRFAFQTLDGLHDGRRFDKQNQRSVQIAWRFL